MGHRIRGLSGHDYPAGLSRRLGGHARGESVLYDARSQKSLFNLLSPSHSEKARDARQTDRANCCETGSWREVSLTHAASFALGLPHQRANSLTAHDALAVLSEFARIEDHAGSPINVVERDVTHRRQHPTIGRVVAIVAHHEGMPCRHHILGCVVVKTIIDAIQRFMA